MHDINISAVNSTSVYPEIPVFARSPLAYPRHPRHYQRLQHLNGRGGVCHRSGGVALLLQRIGFGLSFFLNAGFIGRPIVEETLQGCVKLIRFGVVKVFQ